MNVVRLQVLSDELVPTMKAKSFLCVYGGLQPWDNLQGWGSWQAAKTACFTFLKNLPLVFFVLCVLNKQGT